ncbi:hypothetical protein ACS0TY_025561 [Phlomoides rotata]
MKNELRPPSTSEKRKEETPPLHGLKTVCVSTTASIGEGFGYLKAAAVGLTKKLTAKTEKEATDADLQVAKMQVDAADHAEDIKNGLD